MHPRQDLPEAAADLASMQQWVLTSAQLRDLGVTERVQRRMASRWTRLTRGVYAIQPPTWDAMATAGLLVAGRGGCIGSLSGAWLHGALTRQPSTVTVWVDGRHGFPPLSHGPWRVIFRDGFRQAHGSPRRARIEDCLLDLAMDEDELIVVSAITRAFTRRLTTPDRLRMPLDQRPRQRHRTLITDLCGEDGLESALEWHYLHRVERAHRLPTPVRQASLAARTRSDSWYPEWGLLIELDGRSHDDWSRDMARDNTHALSHAALTLRYGWADVTRRPCAVARQVAAALQRRGWSGQASPCRRCAT